MKIRHPAWFRSAIVSNLLAFGCFVASAVFPADPGAGAKAIILGIGFGVAGLYMFVVACKPERKKKK